MSKFNINKESIINKLRTSKRYIGITAGILFAIGCSTGAIMHYSNSNEIFPNEDTVIEENVVTETTVPEETVVTTTKANTTTKKIVTTSLLTTTLNTTAGTVIETPTITTVTTLTSSIVPKPAPQKMEQAEEPTTAENITVTESTTVETSTTTKSEGTTTTVAETTVEETTTTTSEPEANREFTVYKPSTHYVHRNTCHWYTDECYEISSTEGLECRYCTECNPDIEIATAYQVPTPTLTSLQYVTEEERIYLCNTVAYEYGSDWVSLYDKACVVATVMNRVRDGGWTNGLPSTVYNVLTAPYQYNPVYATPYYSYNVTQSCIDAVEYYFEHQGDFPHYTSFWGDGRYNYFR